MKIAIFGALALAASVSSALGQTPNLTMSGQGEESVTANVSIVWILQ